MSYLCRTISLAVQAWAIFVIIGAAHAVAQECPRANVNGPSSVSQIRTLQGRLIFHDGLRQWFELKLDRAQCGQRSVQLVPPDLKPGSLEVLRGCRVSASGPLDFSPTGYYSLDVFQRVEKAAPIGICSGQPLLPNTPEGKPDKRIQSYTVIMRVNYRPGDHPIVFHVTDAGRELRPWQVYASYQLTGGFVLYGSCAEGFVVDKVFGTASAKPDHFAEPRTPDDMAMFDPENAASAGKRDLNLGYGCVRQGAH